MNSITNQFRNALNPANGSDGNPFDLIYQKKETLKKLASYLTENLRHHDKTKESSNIYFFHKTTK
jgi:hypothetical protein